MISFAKTFQAYSSLSSYETDNVTLSLRQERTWNEAFYMGWD